MFRRLLEIVGDGDNPANRMTTWQPGVTYNGGIPNRTTVCATLSPLGGTQDDTAQIQRAINNCPSGQVVKLNAGTFNIYTSIVIANSNVTLRGAGPGTGASGGIHAPSDLLGAGSVVTGGGTGTFLVKQNRNTNNYGLLQISGSSMNDVQDSTNLATDAVLGAYSVTLASNPGITVGTYVLIDENTDNDPDVVWGPSVRGARRCLQVMVLPPGQVAWADDAGELRSTATPLPSPDRSITPTPSRTKPNSPGSAHHGLRASASRTWP